MGYLLSASPYHAGLDRSGPVKRLFLTLLLLCSLGIPEAHAERPRMSAQDAYELGLRYLKRGYYVKALEQLNRVRTYYRDDPYALKAELAIADVHFKKSEWDAARVAYDEFQRAHPRYRDLDYVVYRLGLTLYHKAPSVAARDQTWTRQAVDAWTRFGARFPESTWRTEVDQDLAKARARLARKELLVARFYARREAWQSVVGRIEPMLRQYPDCPDQDEALGLLGVGYAKLGQLDMAQAVATRLQTDAPHSRALRDVTHALEKAKAAPPPAPPAEPAPAPPPTPAP
jgi:outer membrane protein assembly factor BamD